MSELDDAARALANADALLIGAGAGMGVDSGLPDFRGDRGFWRAYPPFERLGLSFYDVANPRWFERDPALAWGFYGHRLNLYQDTIPHDGFQILRRWAADLPHGAFVFTSNVDGQFQRAGFDPEHVVECHGSIHHLQCTGRCREIWPADDLRVDVDDEFRAHPPFPHCPTCGALARPNLLMFGDVRWLSARTDAQEERMMRWLGEVKRPVIVECGAGTSIPSVRFTCERIAARWRAPHIRINPAEHQGPAGTIEIARGALDALTRLDAAR